MDNPTVVDFLYAMSKKNKAERELELIRAITIPHQKQEVINKTVKEREELLESPFDLIIAQHEEDTQEKKTEEQKQRIREFKAFAKGLKR